MNYLYIDESGSMTTKHSDTNGYFVVAILVVHDRKKLKKVFKRYISKKMNRLKELDRDGKMFDEDKFRELKGSALSINFKKDFADYLSENNLFKVLFVTIDNNALKDGKLYESTARAFNYVLKCALTYYIHQEILPSGDYNIQIDERNTKTYSINALEDYLWLDLVIDKELMNNVKIEYFHSEDNICIQIADFFANLTFSSLHNNPGYKETIISLRNSGYLVDNFVFPIG